MAENGFDLDARIERPTERHEALAESVELLIAGDSSPEGDRRAPAWANCAPRSKPRSPNSASQSPMSGAAPAWREKKGSLSDDTQ